MPWDWTKEDETDIAYITRGILYTIVFVVCPLLHFFLGW